MKRTDFEGKGGFHEINAKAMFILWDRFRDDRISSFIYLAGGHDPDCLFK
ncbi:hypothetical protein GCM10007416_25770 [Kroppenstedtia guangzhouensis]|uniref:Uncharacterized protein n=1 Tax=Kroppenstedtia guangzhouensis TaxID=1274356 RepID=A0ABQ1GVZ7_9BACL|nr:hypothetical protein GCM10007416_25770 [Kroppenstedtia guangzhouensis]